GSIAAGLALLLVTAPSVAGAIGFVVLFGFGSGLMSIVGGTLPLELFGRAGYGARVGWITAARQFSSAFAPFGVTALTSVLGTFPALWGIVLIGLFAIAAFATIVVMQQRIRGVTAEERTATAEVAQEPPERPAPPSGLRADSTDSAA